MPNPNVLGLQSKVTLLISHKVVLSTKQMKDEIFVDFNMTRGHFPDAIDAPRVTYYS